MKPRVFVSSTYYDLKYVRESIERFISNYNFEPVLFESGNVTFEHGEELDTSCYNEVNLCHMMILIIGGRYGSKATGDNKTDVITKYEAQFVSITRREYETALSKNLPVFIFIDKNVYSEYQTYSENRSIFESPTSEKKMNFKFAHVDSINVFRFIDYLNKNPIKTFEKFEEIEDYLKNQISGLFYLYLMQLQRKKDEEKVLDTISELNNVTQRMNEMMSEVGKKVIDTDKYNKVIYIQNKLLIELYIQTVSDNIKFKPDLVDKVSSEDCKKIAQILFDEFINDETLKKAQEIDDFKSFYRILNTKKKDLEASFVKINPNIVLIQLDYLQINFGYLKKLKPIIDNDKSNELRSYLLDLLADMIREDITILPF
jgi:hypothetical protein